MKQDVNVGIEAAELSIKVFNADGSLKKDYGIVGYWHKNPLKRLLWRFKSWLQS